MGCDNQEYGSVFFKLNQIFVALFFFGSSFKFFLHKFTVSSVSYSNSYRDITATRVRCTLDVRHVVMMIQLAEQLWWPFASVNLLISRVCCIRSVLHTSDLQHLKRSCFFNNLAGDFSFSLCKKTPIYANLISSSCYVCHNELLI